MKGEGGPLSLPPGLLALLLGLPSSSLALSSVLGGPEPQFPLPGTPSAVGGPRSSLPWPGRWESLWGRGSWLLGFPRPLASRKSALGEGNLAPFSQTKVQGRRLGTPADLYSSGSGFRPQRPREQPQVRVGTRRRHWRAVGETCITPSWIRPPRLWSSGEGSLWTSLLSGLVVCARRVWPGHRALIRGCSSAASALWAPGRPGAERCVHPLLVLVLTLPGTRGRKGGAWKPSSGASVSPPGAVADERINPASEGRGRGSLLSQGLWRAEGPPPL